MIAATDDRQKARAAVFDPADPELINAPYAVYTRLRVNAPLCRFNVGGVETLALSRYQDVARVLNDASARMRAPGSDVPPLFAGGPAEVLWRNAVSMMDPPDHTRLRKPLAQVFTRQRIAALEEDVEAAVAEAIDRVATLDQPNVAHELSSRIPMRVIGQLLGVPESDWTSLEAWTNDVLFLFVPATADAAAIARVHSASQRFLDYFGDLIDERLRRPRDDLISLLAWQQSRDRDFSRDELIGALRGLLTAGIETTAATISAAVLAMGEHPEQFDLLRNGRVNAAKATEELLRWETPVQLAVRYLGEAVTLHGEVLPAGLPVWCLLGSANHDEQFFDEPGRLAFERETAPHHAFGGGRHFCLGAMLARSEIQVFLRQSVRRWRRIQVDCAGLKRRPQFQFRSIQQLVACFSPESGSASQDALQQ